MVSEELASVSASTWLLKLALRPLLTSDVVKYKSVKVYLWVLKTYILMCLSACINIYPFEEFVS